MICFKRNTNPDNPEDIEGIIYDLINTKEFQRLRRIKQLGAVDYVYPGATHTRFAHSIGVAWLTHNAVTSLLKEWDDEKIKQEFKDYNRKQVIIATTCAGLLHDIGHGPFGHTLDKKIYPKSHEEISAKIIKKRTTEVFRVFKKYENKFPSNFIEDVADLIYQEEKSKSFDMISLLPVKDLISSQLDCDRLDFLMRDTYYCGTPIRIDTDYIIRNMMIKDVPHVGHKKIIIKEKAITAIEHYLLSRSLHYKQVAFHKTCMASEALISRICDYLIEKKRGTSVVIKDVNDYLLGSVDDQKPDDEFDKFLEFDDYSFMNYIKEESDKNTELKYLLDNFKNRHLPKKHKTQKNDTLFEKTKEEIKKELEDLSKWSLPKDIQDLKLSIDSLLFSRKVDYKNIYEVNEKDNKKLQECIDEGIQEEPNSKIQNLMASAEKWIFYSGKDSKEKKEGIFNIIEKSEIAKIAIETDEQMYYFRDPSYKETING